MSLVYTTEQLINEVRNQFQSGDTGSLGTTDDDILTYLNKEMLLEVIPQIAKLREEFFIVTELITLTKDNTINDTHVKIPDRAIAQSLRDLMLFMGDPDSTRISLPRINREDLPAFEVVPGTGSEIRGFYIENYRIRVFPSVFNGQKLEVAYMFRPSQLVKETGSSTSVGYRNVTAVGSPTSLDVTTSGSNPWVVGDLVDIHGPNSGAEMRVWDNRVAAVNGNTITLTDPIDGTDARKGRFVVEVGDYIATQEEAAIPMLPRELHVIVAQAAVVRMAEAIDDQEKYQMHLSQLNRQMKLMEFPMGKRVTGRPRKIVNRNSPLWRMGNVQRRSI